MGDGDFIEATETQDAEERDRVMDEILKYNEEDLAETWAVLEWLEAKQGGIVRPA